MWGKQAIPRKARQKAQQGATIIDRGGRAQARDARQLVGDLKCVSEESSRGGQALAKKASEEGATILKRVAAHLKCVHGGDRNLPHLLVLVATTLWRAILSHGIPAARMVARGWHPTPPTARSNTGIALVGSGTTAALAATEHCAQQFRLRAVQTDDSDSRWRQPGREEALDDLKAPDRLCTVGHRAIAGRLLCATHLSGRCGRREYWLECGGLGARS